jgi:hypothetical protein
MVKTLSAQIRFKTISCGLAFFVSLFLMSLWLSSLKFSPAFTTEILITFTVRVIESFLPASLGRMEVIWLKRIVIIIMIFRGVISGIIIGFIVIVFSGGTAKREQDSQ